MEQFWDARAREDPFYFVDSRLRYSAPDEPAFWEGGERALGALLGALEIQLPSGGVVVDIGCGLGRLTRPLAREAGRVIALDVSSEMLTKAKQLNAHLANVEWVHGDGRSLRPIPDATADACISHVVFRHMPNPGITLGYVREMGRVLKPDGFAAFELSNDPAPHRRPPLGPRSRVAALLRRGPRGQDHEAWLGSHVELDAIRTVAAESGMSVERTAGEGTEYCGVLLRRYRPSGASSALQASAP
jgi:SAM-dependent methyltransferase